MALQIFDEGEHIPITPVIEAAIRSLLGVQWAIMKQQKGVVMLNFSPNETHISVWEKHTSADIHRKVYYKGRGDE